MKANSTTDLTQFNNDWFQPGATFLIRTLWFYVSLIFISSGWFPFFAPKRFILRMFGAKIGEGVIIKPSVHIKYPWKLSIGDHSWIGERAWIDNLDQVTIGNHVCLSQGAHLLTGNHNYKMVGFDLMTKPIELEDGVWICANAMVGPGVVCHSHSVLGIASIALKDLESYGVYSGNPAQKIKTRIFLNSIE